MVINWFKFSLFGNNKEVVLETVRNVIILLCSIFIMSCHLRFSNVQEQLFSVVLLLLSLIDGLKFVSAHFLTSLSRFSKLNYFNYNSEFHEYLWVCRYTTVHVQRFFRTKRSCPLSEFLPRSLQRLSAWSFRPKWSRRSGQRSAQLVSRADLEREKSLFWTTSD